MPRIGVASKRFLKEFQHQIAPRCEASTPAFNFQAPAQLLGSVYINAEQPYYCYYYLLSFFSSVSFITHSFSGPFILFNFIILLFNFLYLIFKHPHSFSGPFTSTVGPTHDEPVAIGYCCRTRLVIGVSMSVALPDEHAHYYQTHTGDRLHIAYTSATWGERRGGWGCRYRWCDAATVKIRRSHSLV